MHLEFRNVNDAFRGLVWLFNHPKELKISRRTSRNGNVLVLDEPVTITYQRPYERVLFNTVRDANPFFHLYEALWMLAGRNDVESLAYYNSRMKEFSDDGKLLNGAYGYRWRTAEVPDEGVWDKATKKLAWHGQHGGIDQLDYIVQHLKSDPVSRRAVLQMWSVQDDLLKAGTSKDVCCNLNVMFSLREEEWGEESQHNTEAGARTRGESHWGAGKYKIRKVEYEGSAVYPMYGLYPCSTKLDMTVTNRSNDLIWGLTGANYVHFTVLQEYVAARLGVEVGRYHHFSNNLHVYEWNWKPGEWLEGDKINGEWVANPYETMDSYRLPLVKDAEAFDKELPEFVERWGKDSRPVEYSEPFLYYVAQLMFVAFRYCKEKMYVWALQAIDTVQSVDWKVAGKVWIERRRRLEGDKREVENVSVRE